MAKRKRSSAVDQVTFLRKRRRKPNDRQLKSWLHVVDHTDFQAKTAGCEAIKLTLTGPRSQPNPSLEGDVWRYDSPRSFSMSFYPDLETIPYVQSGAKRKRAIASALAGNWPPGVLGIIWEYAHATWLYFDYTLLQRHNDLWWTLDRTSLSTAIPPQTPVEPPNYHRMSFSYATVQAAVVLSCDAWS